ncbi:ABC transporter ATP-binding protein [Microlunatus soli]|uniref:Peptide/nickel transport system ATP-binding protein n=1 Tax=Microlunatus soli TaxID=630515 RepID=A0A1H1WDQ0_9ACTN|nr:ABC transporter ATP-binding protein [Microlunatus soli]SDS94259.1 peptide/nickel transport system ATP-binding protein [Microlunatus soli]
MTDSLVRERAVPTTPPTSAARRRGRPILDVFGLTVDYLTERGPVRSVNEIDLTLHEREIVGVAGESGSGKSTLITALTRLQRPPAVTVGGSISYHPAAGDPVELTTLPDAALRRLRWNEIAIVLQSAMDCLNPVMRLGDQFADALAEHHRGISRKAVKQRIGELLEMVGVPANRARSYPHELSGGMRQRSLIALALACEPRIVVMDEPTTAVDVVMQRQILAQLLSLQDQLGFAVVFVTHDLSLLVQLADRIAIMYAGRIVEEASAAQIYTDPLHPYARGLRDAFPSLHAPLTELSGIAGSPPDLRNPPSGCPFHPRCPQRLEHCASQPPELLTIGDRRVSCHLHDGTDQSASQPSRSTVR